MRGGDTSIGGPASSFPSTIWSDILATGHVTGARARPLMDQLVRRYWRPVYAYVRAAFRKPTEDAKDLTQAFFAHLLEGGFFEKARAERGTFRGYIKKALRNFVIDAERVASHHRPKSQMLSLDIAFDSPGVVPPSPDESPEQAYDRAWFRCVLDQAIDGLWQHLCLEGKAKQFEVFSMYCLGPLTSPDGFRGGTPSTEEPTYRDVAKKMGMSENEVRHALENCRAELRRILHIRIREYAATDDDAQVELKEILGE